jgi:hypothetical protein
VVTLQLVNLSGNVTAPASGQLFRVTFNVVGQGFSAIHLLQVLLVGTAAQAKSVQVPALSSDGYFANTDCPQGSGKLCRPPLVSVSYSSQRIVAGKSVTFNATASHSQNPDPNNPSINASITGYTWDWGDGLGAVTVTIPVQEHAFSFGNITVTLAVTDSYGIIAFKTFQVRVIRIWIDLVLSNLSIDKTTGIIPGTPLNITAHVSNESTQPENATLEIFLSNKNLGTRQLINMESGVSAQLSVVVDTAGFKPNVYKILAVVDPVRDRTTGNIIENDTDNRNNEQTQYIQLIEPLPAGGLSLVQTFGVAVVAIGGVVAGTGVIRKRLAAKPD